jgi:hypothetical protein
MAVSSCMSYHERAQTGEGGYQSDYLRQLTLAHISLEHNSLEHVSQLV